MIYKGTDAIADLSTGEYNNITVNGTSCLKGTVTADGLVSASCVNASTQLVIPTVASNTPGAIWVSM